MFNQNNFSTPAILNPLMNNTSSFNSPFSNAFNMNQQTFPHPSAIAMNNVNSDQQSQSHESPQTCSNQNSNVQANNSAIHQRTSSVVMSKHVSW